MGADRHALRRRARRVRPARRSPRSRSTATVTSDDEVRRLAGIAIGAPFEAATIDEVTARLRAAKRFESVQVLKRFASIADPSQILLVIIVDEGPVHIEMTGDPVNPTRVVRSRPPGLMVLPMLGREDGYGLTYGARLALPDAAGRNSRLSFPLTWGGERGGGRVREDDRA